MENGQKNDSDNIRQSIIPITILMLWALAVSLAIYFCETVFHNAAKHNLSLLTSLGIFILFTINSRWLIKKKNEIDAQGRFRMKKGDWKLAVLNLAALAVYLICSYLFRG